MQKKTEKKDDKEKKVRGLFWPFMLFFKLVKHKATIVIFIKQKENEKRKDPEIKKEPKSDQDDDEEDDHEVEGNQSDDKSSGMSISY